MEKQEVIEIPVQSEMVPINFMNENHHGESIQENLLPKFSAKGYLPTKESEPRENSPKEGIPEENSTTSMIVEEAVQEDSPKDDSVMEDSTQKDLSSDANEVRSADHTD